MLIPRYLFQEEAIVWCQRLKLELGRKCGTSSGGSRAGEEEGGGLWTVLGLKSQKCWKVLLARHRERFMLSYFEDKERKWRCSITSYLLAVLYSTELYYAGVEETVLQEVGDSGWQLEVAGLPTVTPVWRWEIRNDNVPACQQNTAGLQHGDNYIYINHMISSVSFLSISCPPSRVSWSVIAMLATAQAGRCIRKESY